jgi:membrane dipeptidase
MHIDRRSLLASGLATLAAAPALAQKAAKQAGWYRSALVIDGLGGVFDPSTRDGPLRITDRAWADMQRSGVTAVNQTILPVGNIADDWQQFRDSRDFLDNVISANPERLMRVEKAADLKTAKSSGRIGVIYGTQDTAMIGPALDRLTEMKTGGVRVVQLTYNLGNLSGDGSIEPRNSGLTNLGRRTIERIEAEKLLLDLAHGGAHTIDEAIAHAKRPLTISHTGARAITDHPRNVSDAAIRGVAEKGGVVGCYFMPYLSRDSHPTGGMLLDHIDHIAKIAGEDHVAIGTDGGVLPLVIDEKARADAKSAYEKRTAAGIAAPGEGPDVFTVVEDYNSIDKLERLGNDLMKRGWTMARVEKLLGLNLQRLYGDVWGA